MESTNGAHEHLDLSQRARIRLCIDDVLAYDNNPRKSENPNYLEIKESIETRGLDHVPNVTKRNPSEPFMIKDGGNTRLQILRELWAETQDERFYYIDADYIPWISELDTLAGHMVENESRGGTLFIDRALATKSMRELIESERNDPLSIRELAERISETGWRVQAGNLSRYEYAANVLINLIPNALWSGAGHDLVTKIRKINKTYLALWNQVSPNDSDFFEQLWVNTLREHDSDTKIDLDSIRSNLDSGIAINADIQLQVIASNADALMNGAEADALNFEPAPNSLSSTEKTEGGSEQPSPRSPHEYALDLGKLQSDLFDKAKSLAQKYGLQDLVQEEIPEQGSGYGFVVTSPESPLEHNSDHAHIWWRLFSISCHPFTFQDDELRRDIQEDVANRVFGSFESYLSVVASSSFFITHPENQASDVGNTVRSIENMVANIRLLMAKQ